MRDLGTKGKHKNSILHCTSSLLEYIQEFIRIHSRILSDIGCPWLAYSDPFST